MIDDGEFNDDEMKALGLSLDDDGSAKRPSPASSAFEAPVDDSPPPRRAPPPASAFEPTEDAFNEPRGPVQKGPDVEGFKKLAAKAHKDPTGSGIGGKIFSLLVVVGLAGVALFGWVKLQQAKAESEFKHVRKEFHDELYNKIAEGGGVTAGGIKDAVMQIAKVKGFKISRDEIEPYHEEIGLEFRNTGGAEACDAEADPAVWEEMLPDEQKRFDNQTSICAAREVVGFTVEREVRFGPIKLMAKGAAYTVAKSYSDADDGSSDE
ncbi:MAG: hypothetical protein HYV07_11220 [Deltaproteobacteria bacterium]|nr:hypothetical protein [Deltaproteobacteria bacterium]